MLPVKEITIYAKNFARRRHLPDIEEAESVAVSSMARAMLKIKDLKDPERYYMRFARFAMLQHFRNKKSPCQMPDNFDVEYDCTDKVEGMLEGMKLSATEHKIINLRIAGHTDPEIANILNCSRQLITKYRASLKRKFSDLRFLY